MPFKFIVTNYVDARMRLCFAALYQNCEIYFFFFFFF